MLDPTTPPPMTMMSAEMVIATKRHKNHKRHFVSFVPFCGYSLPFYPGQSFQIVQKLLHNLFNVLMLAIDGIIHAPHLFFRDFSVKGVERFADLGVFDANRITTAC